MKRAAAASDQLASRINILSRNYGCILNLFVCGRVYFNYLYFSFEQKHVIRRGEIQASGGGWRWCGQERPHYSVHPGKRVVLRNTHSEQSSQSHSFTVLVLKSTVV